MEGRHWSRLVIEDIQLEDSGQYTCQPAAGAPAVVTVTVHVQRETEVQAVLGEGQSVISQADICLFLLLQQYISSNVLEIYNYINLQGPLGSKAEAGLTCQPQIIYQLDKRRKTVITWSVIITEHGTGQLTVC